jgi:hypothetical protein
MACEANDEEPGWNRDAVSGFVIGYWDFVIKAANQMRP